VRVCARVYVCVCVCVRVCGVSLVLSTGTKGITQTCLRLRMNLTKLDVRMLCRRLEKAGLIKVTKRLLCILCFRQTNFQYLFPNAVRSNLLCIIGDVMYCRLTLSTKHAYCKSLWIKASLATCVLLFHSTGLHGGPGSAENHQVCGPHVGYSSLQKLLFPFFFSGYFKLHRCPCF